MLRFSVLSFRQCREPCRAFITRRSFGASSDAGDSSEGGTPQQAAATDKADKTKDQNKKLDDKYAASKSYLAGLLSSVKIENQIKIARPQPRKRKSKVKNDEQTPEAMELNENLESVGPEMAEAVKAVAAEVGGGEETQSELLRSLRSTPDTVVNTASRMSDVLSGFEVQKRVTCSTRQEDTHRKRGGFRTFSGLEDGIKQTRIPSSSIFAAESLGIFPVTAVPAKQPLHSLSTWDSLAAHELEQSVSRPPANYFQDQIQMTKQGKIWTFPIDNEIGLEDEKKVGFHEHIFLERHVSSWCPRSGPIRHFIELVCVGLSKNPHVTVQRKIRTLDFFKQYFDDKRDFLKDIGALDVNKDETTETSP